MVTELMCLLARHVFDLTIDDPKLLNWTTHSIRITAANMLHQQGFATPTFKPAFAGKAHHSSCILGIPFILLMHKILLLPTALNILLHLTNNLTTFTHHTTVHHGTRTTYPKPSLPFFFFFFFFETCSCSLAHVQLWLPYFHPHNISDVKCMDTFSTTTSHNG